MRQVQEMAVEFVNALNAAAAAESECAKLRRLLEEERKLVQRLKQEKEDEAQMAKRKIDRMSQRLAEAQKDVEYATTRADVAENEWVRLKRELQESQELVQLLKPENEERRQGVLRQVDDKELELANALNAASITESECDNLRTMLEEERKLVQRLILEKDDEAQLAKRQIEEIGQELADARKCAEYAATRADVAETEWIEAKKELQELSQLLKLECDEMRQSAMRQVEEKERELADAHHASEIAERECAKLKKMLEEEQRLRLEKDDEVQRAKRQIEEMNQELANARKEAELARKDADAAENEWAKLKRMLEKDQKAVQRLVHEKDDEVQLAKRQIEEMDQELANARKEAELARKDADAAENEWTKVKRDLKNMELRCQEIRESASRQEEEKALELANARNAFAIAESECAKFKRMLIEEGKTVQRLIIEKDDEAEVAKRQIEKMGQELASARKEAQLARKEAQFARKDSDIAENEWTKVKRELKEKEELVKLLKLEILEMRQLTMRQVEEISHKLEDARKEAEHAHKEAEHARQEADIAQNEWVKTKKELQKKLEIVQLLKIECQETRESAMRQVEEKEQELADALNAVTAASSSSAAAQDCVICLTNEKDMAFGCGHMFSLQCALKMVHCVDGLCF